MNPLSSPTDLTQLRGLHLPADAGSGAQGEVVLAIALGFVAALLVGLVRLLRARANASVRASALRGLAETRTLAPDARLIAQARLLRRLARTLVGDEAASTQGRDWAATLDRLFATDVFSKGADRGRDGGPVPALLPGRRRDPRFPNSAVFSRGSGPEPMPAWFTAFLSAFDLAAPLALLLLPLPFLAARLLPPERMGSSGALRVPATVVMGSARGDGVAARGRGRSLLIWTLWAALVAALAGPRLVLPATALPASGREIMLVMDLSGSMERRDFAIDGETVTRLTAVKRVGTDFIRRRAGDRIGLVIFANESYVAASPSFDTNTVARALDEATIGLVGRSTGIGDGLGLALKRLVPATSGEASDIPQATSKVVVLMTDGANNAGQTTPRDVAALAKELGVKVHTIALGPRDMSNADGEQDVVDAETLRDISTLTGGTFFRVKTTDDLIAMADSIDAIEGGRAKAPPVPLRQDLWPWPAGLALLCAAGLLVARRKA